jgi:hypothetical protein
MSWLPFQVLEPIPKNTTRRVTKASHYHFGERIEPLDGTWVTQRTADLEVWLCPFGTGSMAPYGMEKAELLRVEGQWAKRRRVWTSNDGTWLITLCHFRTLAFVTERLSKLQEVRTSQNLE